MERLIDTKVKITPEGSLVISLNNRDYLDQIRRVMVQQGRWSRMFYEDSYTLEQIKWERDIAVEQLAQLGYGFGEKPKIGRWIDKGSLSCRCSECGCKNVRETPYCPYCGIKMKEEGTSSVRIEQLIKYES